jgi:hypothetical protein
LPRFSYPRDDTIRLLRDVFGCDVSDVNRGESPGDAFLMSTRPGALQEAVLYVQPHEVLRFALEWVAPDLGIDYNELIAALDRAVDY